MNENNLPFDRNTMVWVDPKPKQCFCDRFFARFRCNTPLECDCPKCQGYCLNCKGPNHATD